MARERSWLSFGAAMIGYGATVMFLSAWMGGGNSRASPVGAWGWASLVFGGICVILGLAGMAPAKTLPIVGPVTKWGGTKFGDFARKYLPTFHKFFTKPIRFPGIGAVTYRTPTGEIKTSSTATDATKKSAKKTLVDMKNLLDAVKKDQEAQIKGAVDELKKDMGDIVNELKAVGERKIELPKEVIDRIKGLEDVLSEVKDALEKSKKVPKEDTDDLATILKAVLAALPGVRTATTVPFDVAKDAERTTKIVVDTEEIAAKVVARLQKVDESKPGIYFQDKENKDVWRITVKDKIGGNPQEDWEYNPGASITVEIERLPGGSGKNIVITSFVLEDRNLGANINRIESYKTVNDEDGNCIVHRDDHIEKEIHTLPGIYANKRPITERIEVDIRPTIETK